MNANAEGLVDLSALAAGDPKNEARPTLYTPDRLAGRPEGPAGARHAGRGRRWLNGKPVTLSGSGGDKGEPADARPSTCPRGQGRS